MIIVTVYPTTPYVVVYSVAVRNLKFYLIPIPKREFLSFYEKFAKDGRHCRFVRGSGIRGGHRGFSPDSGLTG